jgi:hypothetical protein
MHCIVFQLYTYCTSTLKKGLVIHFSCYYERALLHQQILKGHSHNMDKFFLKIQNILINPFCKCADVIFKFKLLAGLYIYDFSS